MSNTWEYTELRALLMGAKSTMETIQRLTKEAGKLQMTINRRTEELFSMPKDDDIENRTSRAAELKQIKDNLSDTDERRAKYIAYRAEMLEILNEEIE